MTHPDPEQRFIALETKIAYQEKTIADLNEVVTDQARLADELTKRITLVEKQLRAVAEPRDMPQEKPPHY